ncbi:MAG: prepilin-type N-terminal cleavage/methylation domain-containing protein, partial [Okeania sp. SIO3C4]|nr:prepilin-type N-terminal cleavage/methylation domain-containing protein [Okeania sp. SIO3C4]
MKMENLLRLLLKIPLKGNYSKSASAISGFTMIELLVGTIIAAIIITPLLAFVVDILNTDVREQAKTNTEQEVQSAAEYISKDLSQAV